MRGRGGSRWRRSDPRRSRSPGSSTRTGCQQRASPADEHGQRVRGPAPATTRAASRFPKRKTITEGLGVGTEGLREDSKTPPGAERGPEGWWAAGVTSPNCPVWRAPLTPRRTSPMCPVYNVTDVPGCTCAVRTLASRDPGSSEPSSSSSCDRGRFRSSEALRDRLSLEEAGGLGAAPAANGRSRFRVVRRPARPRERPARRRLRS